MRTAAEEPGPQDYNNSSTRDGTRDQVTFICEVSSLHMCRRGCKIKGHWCGELIRDTVFENTFCETAQAVNVTRRQQDTEPEPRRKKAPRRLTSLLVCLLTVFSPSESTERSAREGVARRRIGESCFSGLRCKCWKSTST